jgi:hypothetical protein
VVIWSIKWSKPKVSGCEINCTAKHTCNTSYLLHISFLSLLVAKGLKDRALFPLPNNTSCAKCLFLQLCYVLAMGTRDITVQGFSGRGFFPEPCHAVDGKLRHCICDLLVLHLSSNGAGGRAFKMWGLLCYHVCCHVGFCTGGGPQCRLSNWGPHSCLRV